MVPFPAWLVSQYQRLWRVREERAAPTQPLTRPVPSPEPHITLNYCALCHEALTDRRYCGECRALMETLAPLREEAARLMRSTGYLASLQQMQTTPEARGHRTYRQQIAEILEAAGF